MKKILFSILIISPNFFNVSFAGAPPGYSEVSHDTTQLVTLSNRDINRIVCRSGVINNTIYSEEKGVQVVSEGSNAFVKYLIKLDSQGIEEYVTKPTEIHIICDEKTYTLIAQPSHVNAKTVYLGKEKNQREDINIGKYGGLDHEERIIQLTRNVYRNELGDGYDIKKETQDITIYPKDINKYSFFKQLRIRKVRSIIVDGIGLKAEEYQISTDQEVEFKETDFLESDLGMGILSVTLSRHSISPGEIARMIIVKRADI